MLERGHTMGFETAKVSHGTLAENVREALDTGMSPIMTRMVLRFFRALAHRHPFLRAQLARTRRRILALNLLEWRALRAGFIKDFRNQTRSKMVQKVENWLEDPTSLIETLDGRLTWIEGATDEQLAEESATLPFSEMKLEEVLENASHKLSATGFDGHFARRIVIAALFDKVAERSPNLSDRIAQVKHRILALGVARSLALQAADWQETKEMTIEQLQKRFEEFLENPGELLSKIEQRLDAVEAFSSEEVEEKAASLPKVFMHLRELMESAKEYEPV